MATLEVRKSSLAGALTLPPSKSHTMRALLFGAMGTGVTRIFSPLMSPDTEAMIQALKLLGVHCEGDAQEIRVFGGKLFAAENVIDAGNSGQVLRFVGALATLLPSYTILTGDHSIRHLRPMQQLLEGVRQLGGFAESSRQDGKAPVIIRGPLAPGIAKINGEDSQPISALLIATSFLNGKSELIVENPGEKPWIDMTLFWLEKLGGKISHSDYRHYWIEGPLSYPGFECTIPGDWSAAAFPLAAAFVTRSPLTLKNIDISDIQGDKKILPLLESLGATTSVDREKKEVTFHCSTPLRGATIDASEMIDAVPILAVMGCFGTAPLEVVGAASARHKESDRIRAIVTELKKMGGVIEERKEGFVVHPCPLVGAKVESHADHRIAMALTVAALGATGTSTIADVSCIAKSYPTFVQDLKSVGGNLS